MPTGSWRQQFLALLLLSVLIGCHFQTVGSAPVKGRKGAAAVVDDEEDHGAQAVDDNDDDDSDDDEPWRPQKGARQGQKPAEEESKKAGQGRAGTKGLHKESKAKARVAAQSAHLPDDDDEEEQLDADEFEGFDIQKTSLPPPKSGWSVQDAEAGKSKQGSDTSAHPAAKRQELLDFIPEMAGVLFLVVYMINYLYGNAVNKRIAQEWLDTCRDVLDENFALVGIQDCHKMQKEGASAYTLYCSGRQNCESMTVYLELQPRHDLFSIIADLFRMKVEDKLTLEILMGDGPETGGTMDSFNFAVCQKSEETRLREENSGLASSLSAKRWKTELHDSLVCISDEEEVTRELLPEMLVWALNQHKQYLRSIIASDKLRAGYNTLARTRPAIKMEFFLLPYDRYSNKEGGGHKPRAEKLRVAESLMRVGLRYMDKVVGYQMSAGAKERMKKISQQLAEEEFKKSRGKREQEAQTRKLEKLRKEKEAMEALSPEAAAKYEEKMLKKQMKTRVQMRTTKMR